MFAASLALSVLCSPAAASNDTVSVGVFTAAGLFGRNWSPRGSSNCSRATGQTLHECNLEVYKAAAATAANAGVELLVFPEAYSLGDLTPRERYYEPLADDALGTAPCGAPSAAKAPAQRAMACAAAEHSIGIAVNVMTQLANGTRHITELVFDTSGVLASIYHKRLFPLERLWVAPGPIAPTSFELLGQRWGVVVCWEGLEPFLTRDFSQFEALAAQGASVFLWPVLSTVELDLSAQSRIAQRFGVKVVGTGGYGRLGPDSFGAFTDERGSAILSRDVVVPGTEGFNGNAVLRVASLNFATPLLI